jgi:lysozyme
VMMQVTTRGIELIKKQEALRLKAYPDTGGVWTIGYGHTKGVKRGDVCTAEQAEQWLIEDTASAVKDVNRLVQVVLTQNQFDALVSFVFNVGGSAFSSSTMLIRLNAGDYLGTAKQFSRWIYDDGKVQGGLITRRAREAALFGESTNG